MWADELTKVSKELIEQFQAWLLKPICNLVDQKEKKTSVNFMAPAQHL